MIDRLAAVIQAGGYTEETANNVARTLSNLDAAELIAALNSGEPSTAQGEALTGTSGVISLAEMLDGNPDLGLPEAVAERVAWRGRVTAIFSREKVGKSTFMTWVASCLTNCLTMLGWKPGEAGRVLWFGLEEHPNDVAYRNLTFGTDPQRFFFLAWSSDPLHELELAICEVDPDLVVIDSLSAYVELAAPASGEASSWKAQLGPLTRLARKYDIALVIIHHSNKGKDAEYRDSTAIGAEMDMLIEMREGDVPGVRMFTLKGRWKVDKFSVIYEEQNGDALPSFRLAHGELAVDQKILLFLKANPGSTKRAIRDGVGGRSADVDGAIFHLLKSKRIKDNGDDHRSEFYIRQSQTGKPLSHGMDTLGTRSGHVDGAKACPDDHTPLRGGGSGTMPATHELPWDESSLLYEDVEREAIQAEASA